jgi:hypothetical protein
LGGGGSVLFDIFWEKILDHQGNFGSLLPCQPIAIGHFIMSKLSRALWFNVGPDSSRIQGSKKSSLKKVVIFNEKKLQGSIFQNYLKFERRVGKK